MGRMESIQSDSSGFAEGDTGTDHQTSRDTEERDRVKLGISVRFFYQSILPLWDVVTS